MAKKILNRTVLLLDIELDNVSVPPIDGTTGASRPSRNSGETFEKTRGQIILGVEQGFTSTTTLAVNLYRSQEVDYLSNSVIATFSQDLFQRNTTLTLRAQYNDDKVGELTESNDLINNKKTKYTGSAQISQVLSQTTVLNLMVDAEFSEGYLRDPYRQVKVYDSNNVFQLVDEIHPDERLRQAASFKINQYITPVEASLIGSYRYYFDDWDVKSHTFEIRFNKYIIEDLIFGASYRYYTQGSADFYQDVYRGDNYFGNVLRTNDYKLKKFDSNNFGFKFSFLLRAFAGNDANLEFLQNSSIDFMYLRYFNSLDFSANIFQGSIKFSI